MPPPIRIEGLTELNDLISQWPDIAIDETADAVEQSVQYIAADAAVYPPQRTGSSYRRTGTLGRRWGASVTVLGSSVSGLVNNPTNYGPQVMGDEGQIPIHKKLWRKVGRLLTEALPAVEGFLQAAADRITGRLAGDKSGRF